MQIEEEKNRVLRCTLCRTEIPDSKELETATCCPSCGTTSLPQYVDMDVTITLNWHDLRILCMWAKSYETKMLRDHPEIEQRSVVDVLTTLLAKYKPNGAAPLSLLEELKEAAEALGLDGEIAILETSDSNAEPIKTIVQEKKTIH